MPPEVHKFLFDMHSAVLGIEMFVECKIGRRPEKRFRIGRTCECPEFCTNPTRFIIA